MTDHGDQNDRMAAPARAEHFLRQLDSELELCAQVRWDDPVSFAWRARRCAEVVLLGVLARHAPQSLGALKNPTIDTLIRHEKLKREGANSPIPRDIFSVVDTVQNFGNTAAHYQIEDVAHEENAIDVARALSRLVEWFYRTQQAMVPAEVQRLLDALRDRTHRVANATQRAVDLVRQETSARLAEHERWEQALRYERDEARSRLADREREIDGLRGQLDAATQVRSDAHARIAFLERQLAEARAPLPAHPPAERGRSWSLVGIGALVGAVIGAACAVALTVRTGSRTESPTPTVHDVRSLPAPAPQADVLAVVVGDVPPVTPGAVEHLARCPDDFERVDARRVALKPLPDGQRPWGRVLHPEHVQHFEVPPFCLQRRPVTVAEFQETLPEAAVSGDCARPSGSPRLRVTCVLQADAARYCERRWQAALPTIVQWEAATRAVEAGLAREVQPWRRASGATGAYDLEWTADAFPASPFDLGPPRRGFWMTRAPIPVDPLVGDYPRQSWNQHAEGRDVHIGFRCVAPPR